MIPIVFFQVIRAYALNKTWVIGFLMDIFGALLMLRALSLAPVSALNLIALIVYIGKKINESEFEGISVP